jgi:hypothetical protein
MQAKIYKSKKILQQIILGLYCFIRKYYNLGNVQ